MGWTDDLNSWVEEIYGTNFEGRKGNIVPDSDSVRLKDGAVEVEATFLYADLAGSSKLAAVCPWTTTAKIIRAYLHCAVKLIRAYDGHIRSFDGDRVMGVFMGESKNTNASYCAREIDWTVHNIINPKAQSQFKSISNNSIRIGHCVGLDTGDARAVRAGIRNNNDLIWIGKAPSFAAKLSDIRDFPREVYISKRVYNLLADSAKTSNGANIWTAKKFKFAGAEEIVYGTNDVRKP
jgi:class 3 adenylate cyclase